MSEQKRIISGSFEGLPYRGPAIDLKETDNIEEKLRLNQVLHVDRFELGDDAQRGEYTRICQLINDAHAQMSFEDIKYNEERRHWVVLLRWIELWYSAREEPRP